MTIQEILEEALNVLIKNKISDPMLKSRLLLAFVLNVEKEYLIVNDNKEIIRKDRKKI